MRTVRGRAPPAPSFATPPSLPTPARAHASPSTLGATGLPSRFATHRARGSTTPVSQRLHHDHRQWFRYFGTRRHLQATLEKCMNKTPQIAITRARTRRGRLPLRLQRRRLRRRLRGWRQDMQRQDAANVRRGGAVERRRDRRLRRRLLRQGSLWRLHPHRPAMYGRQAAAALRPHRSLDERRSRVHERMHRQGGVFRAMYARRASLQRQATSAL